MKANPNKARGARTYRQRLEKQFKELCRRAMLGSQPELDALKATLRSPEGSFLIDALGDLTAAAQRDLIAYHTKNPLAQEATRLKLEQLRVDLCGPAATPLEKLLVERVLHGWLQVHLADSLFATAENASIAQGDYYQRNQSRAQARYLAAIKTLVTIRKLLQPALSPLELATKTVSETTGKSGGIRRGGRTPVEGLAVEN